jgi:hypothetical protein
MYPKISKPLPIDPDFDIRHHLSALIKTNANAYDNFAILMGMLNDAPCQTITFHYQDAQYLLQFLKTTKVNPVNIFSREQCLAFSRQRTTLRWFAFLQRSVMVYGSQDFIGINYTHQAGEKVENLCEYIQKLFQQHNTYAGKIYIMNEESSKFTLAKLKNRHEKELVFSAEHQIAFEKIVETISKKKDVGNVVVIAGEDQKPVANFIKQLTYAIPRRFLYITQRDAPNVEYDFLHPSFGKGNNVFIVENAEEYPRIKDVYEESLAGYIQQLLKGKMKKAFDEPLIVTINGSLEDFPGLKHSYGSIVIGMVQL